MVGGGIGRRVRAGGKVAEGKRGRVDRVVQGGERVRKGRVGEYIGEEMRYKGYRERESKEGGRARRDEREKVLVNKCN